MMEPEGEHWWLRQLPKVTQDAADDPAAFRQMGQIIAQFEEARRAAIPALLDQGFSWADIGQGENLTRQAAWKKYHAG